MSKKEQSIEEKIVFAIGEMPEGPPMLLIGLTEAAWKYCKDGDTHNLDLTSIGVPIKLVLFGCKDHDAAMKVINTHNASIGSSYLDMRGEDFELKPKDKG